MVDSAHTPDHVDHADPASELERVIATGELEERTWPAENGNQWALEHLEDEEDEKRVVLSLLSPDHELVCQASTVAPS